MDLAGTDQCSSLGKELANSKMSYIATVYNVMIASPSDVAPERQIVRDVIHEWNDIHSEGRAIRLAPVGWDTHSSPQMGNHPQVIINEKVLERCDLLVGIFWTRIGTATRDHASGTVEEIEEHIKAGKPAMLYFSRKPVELDSVDRSQYDQVVAFKKSCRERGIYHEYSDLNAFQADFYRHLQLALNDTSRFSSTTEPTTERTADGHPAATEGGAAVDRVRASREYEGLLSKEAAELLLEARSDKDGTILYTQFIGGSSMSTNGRDFLEGVKERRIVARWEAALEELISIEALVDRGYKGELFQLTSRGYALADAIASETSQKS